MSGFSYPSPIFTSPTYNPAFYLSLDSTGYLTYDYAQTLYLSKYDFRLSYITGIAPGTATSGIALVPDASLGISGLGAISCSSMDVSGVYKQGGSVINTSALTGIVDGTAAANKALVLDSNKTISGIKSMYLNTALTGWQWFLTCSNSTITADLLMNTDCFLGTRSNHSFVLMSNNIRRLTCFGPSGNVAIAGNTDLGFTLSVGGTINAIQEFYRNGVLMNTSCLTGITNGTALANKALILDASTNITGINQITCGTVDSSSYKQSGVVLDFSNVSGITPGVAAGSKALVLNTSGNIIGINSLGSNDISCTTLSVNGVAITGSFPSAITGASLNLTGSDNMIVLTNPTALSRSTILFYGDAVSSRWEYGARGSASTDNANSIYWYNQSAYKMILSNTGSLSISGTLNCAAVSSGGAITCVSDLKTTTGDILLDDAYKLIFCRNTTTKDINSYIHCDGNIGRMVIQSSRGGGDIQIRTNISGGADATKPCVSFFENNDWVNPTLSIYNNGQISFFNDPLYATRGPADAKVFAPWNSITASHFLARCYPSNSSTSTYGSQNAAYVWYHAGLGLGSATPLCGLGPHDQASGSNRTRMGLISSTGLSYENGTYPWDGAGLSMYAGSWNTTSDIRLKSNIEASPYGLAEVLQLDAVRYDLAGDTTGKKIGLIAQSVLPILPELISLSGDQNDDPEHTVYLSLDYTMLGPVLVKAIQQMSQLIESQSELIASMSNRLDRMEARPVVQRWLAKMSPDV